MPAKFGVQSGIGKPSMLCIPEGNHRLDDREFAHFMSLFLTLKNVPDLKSSALHFHKMAKRHSSGRLNISRVVVG